MRVGDEKLNYSGLTKLLGLQLARPSCVLGRIPV